MSYQHFAYYYDQLMEDAPYEQWISFLNRRLSLLELTYRVFLMLVAGQARFPYRLR